MAGPINPGEKSAAESDYEKKFNRQHDDAASDSKALKEKEAAGGDAEWKTTAAKQSQKSDPPKKGRFRFVGRRGGKIRQGSAFAFIIAMLGLGVWYTSVFAPNILLVNLKEMYTNDLTDATIALNNYYWKLMNYKIGRAQCGEKDSIKCKLTTMSRAQYKAFEKHGFVVLGTKVEEDNMDDGQPNNDKPESRYQVTAILPPAYMSIVNSLTTKGLSLSSSLLGGRLDQLGSKVSGETKAFINEQIDKASDPKEFLPIASGDLLWLYSQLSSADKALVYGVFNPKSGFFQDTRFKQRIKSKYGLTKDITVGGNTEQAVNKSFDSSVQSTTGGIDLFGRPDPKNGISLANLSSPTTALQLEAAMLPLAAQSNSFVGLQCAWYSFGKAVTNDAKSAKAATVARFAMQYLKAADQVKIGTSDDVTINTLSGKLAQSSGGNFTGPNATDSSMYKSIVYGTLPIPSIFGFLYYLDTFDLIAALIPSWSQIMASAAAQGTASGVSGQLTMPPANLMGNDRQYCLDGETTQNHTAIKDDSEGKCAPQIIASAPPGWQAALEHVLLLGRQNCPPPHYDEQDHTYEGQYIMQPVVKATAATLSAYVAGIFSVNVIAWANVMQLLFTSQTTGVAASDAIFAGTGEVLGDMAQSRGMMPGNLASMSLYLAQKDEVEKNFNEVAQYNARKNPFDPYNKFSFIGSIVHGLSPTYIDQAPVLSTLSNSLDILGSSLKRLNPSADAIYYQQPDPFNPLRLSCPDPEYLAILINADVACNVRYSMGPQELLAQPDSVLDYMTKSHSDAYKSQIEDLTKRVGTADVEGDQANVQRMLDGVMAVSQQPFIDKKTGKATPGSEYDKYLQYCVNRQDPWGRSGIAVQYQSLSDEIKRYRLGDKSRDLEPVSPLDRGDPYEQIPIAGFPSITEGAKDDQDWYTGKKCLNQDEMLMNFRAYTMLCSVDGTLSGGVDCTDNDSWGRATYSNDFFTSNDILYTSG